MLSQKEREKEAKKDKQTGYPSIDKPWLKYYTDEVVENHLLGKTVYMNIYSTNASHLDDVAMNYFGKKISYRQMFDSIEQTKNALTAFGVKENDQVILFASSTPETIYTVLALCRIGAVANLINPLFTDEDCVDRINETDAKLAIVLDQLYDKISGILPDTCIQHTIIVPVVRSMPIATRIIAGIKLNRRIRSSKDIVYWGDFLKSGRVSAPDAPYEKDRPFVMVYSSGSTGASKGIVLTNDGINATLLNYFRSDYFPHERGETMLQIIPIWFSTGIVLSILMPLCVGVTTILEPVFSKETFARDLRRYKPNLALAATSLWLYVAGGNNIKHADLSGLHYPITGGEKIMPRDEELINHKLSVHGCKSKLLKGYGMCELGGTVTTDSEEHIKPKACGFPIMNVIVAAFDPVSNQELKYGERGELRVCSPSRMKEYYKNPAATKEFFQEDSEGRLWGCTGDIGYVDEDGFVYVLGRAKDHFHCKNGELVYLFDIEEEILKDEDVDQCKVVYFKTPARTEIVAHIVIRNDICDNSGVIERVHCRLERTLPEYMIPHYYKARLNMPVHNNGKLDTRALRNDKEGLVPAEEIKSSNHITNKTNDN